MTVTLSDNEAKLVVEFLDQLSDILGNRSCNDFSIAPYFDSPAEMMAFVREFYEWNGDPEECEELSPINAADWLGDHCVATTMARRIEKRKK